MQVFTRKTGPAASGLAEPLSPLASHGPQAAGKRSGRLSYLAFRTVTQEGRWRPRAVEGEIPREICGTLFRNGPGQKENFNVPLDHLFDGDAYVTAIRFENGRISGLSRFLDTPERLHERKCGRMRYHEFGTRCPGRALGAKNPPSVNVFLMAHKNFALSEGAPPVAIDPTTLDCLGYGGAALNWPARTTFTAHPKRDPVSGDVFAYGLKIGLTPELVIARLPSGRSAFEIIARVRVAHLYPVHDFVITRSYVVMALPPLYVNMWGMLRNRSCIAENLVAEGQKPLRIIVARKDGQGAPTILESFPANMIFHHGNAVESEDGGTIRLISMETEAVPCFRLLKGWGGGEGLAQPQSQMTEFRIDLNAKTVARTQLTEGAPIEFPAIDPRTLGRSMETIYALRTCRSADDPLAFDTLTSWDGRRFREARAEPGQAFGEPIAIVDAVGQSWIVHLGYDSDSDETFVDIRDPVDLRRVARAWFGFRVPLGFHGCFAPEDGFALRH